MVTVLNFKDRGSGDFFEYWFFELLTFLTPWGEILRSSKELIFDTTQTSASYWNIEHDLYLYPLEVTK